MVSLFRFGSVLAVQYFAIWMTGTFLLNSANAINGYSYVLTRCRTEGNLSVSFFVVNYGIGQTVQTDYLVEFMMTGDNPFIGIDISWFGNKTNAVLDKATLTVFSSLFSMQNGSSERFLFWDDPYYSNFFPEVSKNGTDQYTCSYSFNLTYHIKEAETKFANKIGLANANQSYLGARLFFSTAIDTVREQGQERHLEFIFQKGNLNMLSESAFLFEISVSIPNDAEFIGEATLDGIGMNKILKRVEGYTFIQYSDLSCHKTVAEWEVPNITPIWQVPPYSWLLSALLGALIVSPPVSLVFSYLRYRYMRPCLSIDLVQRSSKEPAIHPRSRMAFYHLVAVNKGRTTAFDSELQLSFKDSSGKELFCVTGKWDRGPEPLGPIGKNYMSQVWPSLIPFGERVNIRPGISESFCVVVKDNEDYCYAFGGESYLYNYKNPKWQLPLGEFIMEVVIKSGNAKRSSKFLLRNKGSTVQDIEISRID
jgi:hypothetical protein